MKAIVTRASLTLSTALVGTVLLPAQAWAQDQAGNNNGGLEEIVVTAQKREQSVQDVPIAVTALSSEVLEANRVVTVQDLSGLAPGMIVRPSAGGIATPSFTIRGQNSFGVVAGSDKQISIYLDGVYISSPRGSIFDLPDVARIEVLRGPQGTLFGRNATGGAVSVTTRDPTGELHAKLSGSIGNRGAYRIRSTIETPEIGPFSAYFTYVRNYRHGDIRNANGGLVWDRTSINAQGFAPSVGIFNKPVRSVKWLGTQDTQSYFGAVKFEPTDTFKMVYKYDRNEDQGSPEGTAFVGHDPNYAGGAFGIGGLIEALTTSQPTFQAPNAKRPDIVANGWVTPRIMRVEGHSLTATWNATDNITLKNVFAYRKVFVHATSAIDGVGSLVMTPQAVAAYQIFLQNIARVPPLQAAAAAQAAAGKRFQVIGTTATSSSKQYSDELQLNWNAGPLQATLGALWFHSRDESGHAGNTISLTVFPNTGVANIAKLGFNINKATSLAAYAQLEYSITDQITLVGGARITKDKKDESFTYGNAQTAPPNLLTGLSSINPPTYKKTKPNFLVGLNWKPNQRTLVYGKFSTSFVSGGASIGVPYSPETATSWELGVKADMLDNKLRANLALFHVKYKHFQSPQGTSQVQSADLIRLLTTPLFGATIANQLPGFVSTFVVDGGDIRAQGAELELTAAPTRGLTMGGSLAFTDTKFTRQNPLVVATNGGSPFANTQRPKWTGTLWAAYETQPLWDDAVASFRVDGTYFGEMKTDTNQFRTAPELLVLRKRPAFWTWNGRAAIKDIDLDGVKMEVAVWGKNIFDNKSRNFELVQELIASANFIPARSFGLDVTFGF